MLTDVTIPDILGAKVVFALVAGANVAVAVCRACLLGRLEALHSHQDLRGSIRQDLMVAHTDG